MSALLLDLVSRFGGPAYVYDLAAVDRAHADLCASLPEGSGLYYSLKANPHRDLVARLAALGAHAEVCSSGEIDTALAAGMSVEGMLMTGPGKSVEAIDHALSRGVRRFSVDSPTDLDRVGERAARAGTVVTALLRVNADEPVPGAGLAMTGTASQFGADASWVCAEPERFRGSRHAPVRGLHLYMGTGVLTEDDLVAQFEVAVDVAARLETVLGRLEEIDLGGGFGAPYARSGSRAAFPDLRERLEALLDSRVPGWRSGAPAVSFESGRYLVSDSGTLLCEVLDVKRSKDELFVVLSSGINHLGGMSGLRRVPRVCPQILRPGSDGSPVVEDGEGTGATLVGPLCTPLDTWGRGVSVPAVRPGDIVAVPNVGAYGPTGSLLAFLSHAAPVEIVLDGDVVLDAGRLEVRRVPVAPRSTSHTDPVSLAPEPAGLVAAGH